MARQRPMVIAYDISDNRTRARVRRILRHWSLGGQKSVFECHLSTGQAEELFMQIGMEIDPGTDSLLMVWLEPRREVLGRGKGRPGGPWSGFGPAEHIFPRTGG